MPGLAEKTSDQFERRTPQIAAIEALRIPPPGALAQPSFETERTRALGNCPQPKQGLGAMVTVDSAHKRQVSEDDRLG